MKNIIIAAMLAFISLTAFADKEVYLSMNTNGVAVGASTNFLGANTAAGTGVTITKGANGLLTFSATVAGASTNYMFIPTNLPAGSTVMLITNGFNVFYNTNRSIVAANLPAGAPTNSYQFMPTNIANSTLTLVTNGWTIFFNTNRDIGLFNLPASVPTNGYVFMPTNLPAGSTLSLMTNGWTVFYNTNRDVGLANLPSSVTNVYNFIPTNLPAGATTMLITNGQNVFYNTNRAIVAANLPVGTPTNGYTFMGTNLAAGRLSTNGWTVFIGTNQYVTGWTIGVGTYTYVTNSDITIFGAGNANANVTFSLSFGPTNLTIYGGTYSGTVYTNVNGYALVISPGPANRCDVWSNNWTGLTFPDPGDLYYHLPDPTIPGGWIISHGVSPAPTIATQVITTNPPVYAPTNTGVLHLGALGMLDTAPVIGLTFGWVIDLSAPTPTIDGFNTNDLFVMRAGNPSYNGVYVFVGSTYLSVWDTYVEAYTNSAGCVIFYDFDGVIGFAPRWIMLGSVDSADAGYTSPYPYPNTTWLAEGEDGPPIVQQQGTVYTISDAPRDNNLYARSNGIWTQFSVGGSGSALVLPKVNPPARTVSVAQYSTNQSLVGTVGTGFSAGVQRAEVSDDGKMALVTGTGTTIKFICLTNPASPVVVATVTTPDTVLGVGHFRNTFYVAGSSFIRAYTASFDSSPVNTYDFATTDSDNIQKIGVSDDGFLMAATVVGGLAGPGQVYIFSLANPNAPQYITKVSCGSGSWAQDMAKYGNYIYVADYTGYLLVIDVTDIEFPVIVYRAAALVAEDPWGFEPWRTLIRWPALYLSDDGYMKVYSLLNPTNPVAQVFATTNIFIGSDVEGSRLVDDMLVYNASGVHNGAQVGIYSYDLKAPLNPVLLTFTNNGFTGGYYWIAVDKNYVYVPETSNFRVFNKTKLPRFSDTDSTLLVGLTNAIIMPSATNNPGRELEIKITSAVTNIVAFVGSETVDTAATYAMAKNQSVKMRADGTNYSIIARTAADQMVLTNAFSLNTKYTNSLLGGFFPRDAKVSFDLLLASGTGASGQASLFVASATATNVTSAGISGVTNLVARVMVSDKVGPNDAWWITDESSGTGASSAIISTNCTWKSQ